MIKDEKATHTLKAPFAGPFRAARCTSHGTYVLRDTMSQLLARNYAPKQLKLALNIKAPRSYVVESIVSQRDVEGKRFYTVKWAGYDKSENSESPTPGTETWPRSYVPGSELYFFID